MVRTWVWHRHKRWDGDALWWAIQQTSIEEITLQVENVMGKFIRRRRRLALDLYRACWEQMVAADDRKNKVSALWCCGEEKY